MWLGFAPFVASAIALDLGVFRRTDREMRKRDALARSGVWVAIALAFGAWVHARFGADTAAE